MTRQNPGGPRRHPREERYAGCPLLLFPAQDQAVIRSRNAPTLGANVHDSGVVLAIIGWFMLLPGVLLGSIVGSSNRITTVIIYVLVIAANLIVWAVDGMKLRVPNHLN